MSIQWGILGSSTVAIDAHPVELSRRPRTVLVLLLADPGHRVSIDRLADALWGGEPPKNHRNSVARFVADLRRSLGPYGERIVTSDGGYLIEVEEGELDAERVSTLVDRARSLTETDVSGAVVAITEAKDLAGNGPNQWLTELRDHQALVRRHDALRVEVLDVFAGLMLRAGRHVELVADLEHAVEQHPHDEGLWQHLITAFQRSGRSAEALRACQRMRTELGEIGLEPAEESVQLESSIIAGSSTGTPLEPDLAQVAKAPIGRAEDLRTIEAALTEQRVISIVGAEGLGKSHLGDALIRDAMLEGTSVYRIDVRVVPDAGRLVPTVAAVVGAPPALEVTTAEVLARHLSPVSCLIVLDNCDHLRAACSDLVATLLLAPGVNIVATSRTPLRTNGEYVHRLGPLATSRGVTGAPSASAELFAIDAGLALDTPTSTVADIEAVCTNLRGHPGAICLAAALSNGLTITEVRHRLEADDARDSGQPADAVLDLAWDDLPIPLQGLLARLSVFRGGCTATAASAVCTGDASRVDDGLRALVERRLLIETGDRFELEGAVRRYASDRLSDRRETTIISNRLVDWLLSLTAPWGLPEYGSYAEIGRLLLPEQENLTEGLTFLDQQGRTEEVAWLAIRSAGMWLNHGRCAEASRWLGPLAESDDLSAATCSAIAAVLLEVDLILGHWDMLIGWGERSLELAGDEPLDWVPMVAGFFAMLALLLPMEQETDEYLDMAQRTAQQSQSRRTNEAMVLLRRAQVAHHRRNYDEAVEGFRRALDLVSKEGRMLLALEMGEVISLYNAGRKDEALAAVGALRSRPDTDEWHYQVDIISAIVIGGCGEPHGATRRLAVALRRHEPVSVWSRANEFQLAFGLLADMRGEHVLAGELLATPMSGSPFLSTMVIEHMLASRDLGPDGYEIISSELASRIDFNRVPHGAATDHHQLEAWWQTGRIDAPAEATTAS